MWVLFLFMGCLYKVKIVLEFLFQEVQTCWFSVGL